ncbi:MAG: holo-ACP synthase [Candidatus Omnitrophica bacterium]|nr:holo-ACP synthase [Candidatus Omnitrophota bacterium]
MILGHGVDIIEVERIEKAIERWGDHFLNHVFCPEEIQYAQKHKFPAQHYAARFAAKEAVFKAISSDPALGWKDIQITKDPHGKPVCTILKDNFRHNIQISISHTKNYAVASAIIAE